MTKSIKQLRLMTITLFSCDYGRDPSKKDKGSTFLAQSIFCFEPFLASYFTRNVPWEYLCTETFIEMRAIFCRDYLLRRAYVQCSNKTDAMSYLTSHNRAFKVLLLNVNWAISALRTKEKLLRRGQFVHTLKVVTVHFKPLSRLRFYCSAQ